MHLPSPETVFFKSVCRAMVDFGYHVSETVLLHANELADHHTLDMDILGTLTFDIRRLSVDRQEPMDHSALLRFVVHIANLLEPSLFPTFRYLCSSVFTLMRTPAVWYDTEVDDDARYAFVFYLLTDGFFVSAGLDRDLEAIASLVLGKPFVLPPRGEGRFEALTLSLFGPVWQSLYMHDELSDTDLITLVLQQRPPLVGCQQHGRCVSLPAVLTG